jgi:hypothetical protein
MSKSNSVAIRCTLIREGGTKIDLYGEHYHFKPTSDKPDAPHVCEIPFEHARQIHRLLSIPGYVLVDPQAELPPKPSNTSPQTIAADKAAPQGNAPVIIKSADGEEINLSALDAEELRALARDTFAIKVHHKWDDKTVIGKIVEATRGED